jgi:hypothetical protein
MYSVAAEEDPVTLEALSLIISRSESEPNDERNIEPDEIPESLAGNGGEDSLESSPMAGGCMSPIDLAMHDITSCLRSKSSTKTDSSYDESDPGREGSRRTWRGVLNML